jgi:hypothetical protein
MSLVFNGGSVWDMSLLPKLLGSILARQDVPAPWPVCMGNNRRY